MASGALGVVLGDKRAEKRMGVRHVEGVESDVWQQELRNKDKEKRAGSEGVEIGELRTPRGAEAES
jgi:hypothetical protein